MSDRPTEVADVPERFDPATMRGEIIEAEHLARYRWVAPLAAGRRVLDAGCGTAYGSRVLADAGAAEVIGVDRFAPVLDDARAVMPAAVTLVVGDVAELEFEADRFDLVVCFEVIEHLQDPGQVLDEFSRVLAPGGVLAISSPNRNVYPSGNPHHLHEYTPEELHEALAKRFSELRLERQHTWITSAVLDDQRFQLGEDAEIGGEVSVRKLVPDATGQETYTLAIAGDGELPRGAVSFELATQVELRRWDALWHEQDEMLRQQAKMLEEQEVVLEEQAPVLSERAEMLREKDRLLLDREREIGRRLREAGQIRARLSANEAELARLPDLEARLDELVQINEELLRREEDIEELCAIAARYTVVVQSSSWRATRPLRRLAALVRGLVR